MKQINHLLDAHYEFNNEYFEGKLIPCTILIKRNSHKDGYYQYRAHKDGGPIISELCRAYIVISEDLYKESPLDWGLIYGTLLHEMIHQYQAEVLNVDPEHDKFFREKARELEDLTGFDVL